MINPVAGNPPLANDQGKEDTDEVAVSGEHDSAADDSDEQPVVQAGSGTGGGQ